MYYYANKNLCWERKAKNLLCGEKARIKLQHNWWLANCDGLEKKLRTTVCTVMVLLHATLKQLLGSNYWELQLLVAGRLTSSPVIIAPVWT